MTDPIAATGDSASPFESARHRTENGVKYWLARDLARILEYADFRNFVAVIEKAKTDCEQSGHRVSDHIGEFTDMVSIGSGVLRHDYSLHRTRS